MFKMIINVIIISGIFIEIIIIVAISLKGVIGRNRDDIRKELLVRIGFKSNEITILESKIMKIENHLEGGRPSGKFERRARDLKRKLGERSNNLNLLRLFLTIVD